MGWAQVSDSRERRVGALTSLQDQARVFYLISFSQGHMTCFLLFIK